MEGGRLKRTELASKFCIHHLNTYRPRLNWAELTALTHPFIKIPNLPSIVETHIIIVNY